MTQIEKIQEVVLKNKIAFYIVKSKEDVLKILKENKTRYYCYVLLCDEEAIVVGKGSNRIDTNKIQASGRSNIIFPGGTAHGHQKALTAALGHLTSKNSLRIIVPVKEEDTALKIEEELKTVLKFGVKKGGKGVMELNEELLDKRLAQLYPGIDLNDFKNTDDFKRFRFLLKEVINPSGCEMANFKNDIYLAEQLFYPGLVKKVKDIFGGYYSDI